MNEQVTFALEVKNNVFLTDDIFTNSDGLAHLSFTGLNTNIITVVASHIADGVATILSEDTWFTRPPR